MRIVLDTSILVRANDRTKGLARDLLLKIIRSTHVLLLSDEMVYEVAKVLRYPRLLEHYGLSEARVFDYTEFLRESAETIPLNPTLVTPIRDVNDIVIMQTAIIGEANFLCTRDRDFFEDPAQPFLRKAGIEVLDDIALMRRLQS